MVSEKFNTRGLQFHNFGRSRSRLVFVSHLTCDALKPQKIKGTRWICMSQQAAHELHQIVHQHSWLQLTKAIEGGFTSDLWKKMRNNFELESAEPISPNNQQFDHLQIFDYGRGNTRITLIADRRATDFVPIRIEGTSLVALSDSAYGGFVRWFRTLPNNKQALAKLFGMMLPHGLSRPTIGRICLVIR